MSNWFVVVAKQNQDYLAARELRQQGYPDVYLPKTFEKCRTDKGRKPVGALLFSPYLFILAEPGTLDPVKNTRGVQALLCDPGGKAAPLRDGAKFIARLRQAEDEELCGASVTSKSGRTDLKRGMQVRIDKPGILMRDGSGQMVPVEGLIAFLSRRKVEVLAGTMSWIVDENDVSEVK